MPTSSGHDGPVPGGCTPAAPAGDRTADGAAWSLAEANGRARQTFMKSAQYAGFIDPSSGRFIKPGNVGGDGPREESSVAPKPGGSDGDDGSDELQLDPLLIALLKKVPPPEKGWPGPSRVRWFRTFAMNVSQIYDADAEPVEMTIELVKETAN